MLKLTGYPSSLQWYAKLGVGITGLAVACIFPKHEKNDCNLSSALRKANFVDFRQSIANIVNFYL